MKQIKVLIADDHPFVIDGLKVNLKDVEGITVIADTKNGAEALRIAEYLQFDIALLDINMPVLDGIETTRQMLAKYPKVKVIALSMYKEKAAVNNMMEAGASGYVLKNADKDELIEAIRKVAAGLNYFSSDLTLTLLEKDSTTLVKSKDKNTSDNLTDREVEIVKLIAQGMSGPEIAEKLFISNRTVDAHRRNIIDKLKLKNVAGIIRYALQNGYVD
jgi:DNA-binding NarL/FixJ family response regulator